MAGPDGDPDHPILPEPFRWELIEFTYRRDAADWRASYIDLVLARDGRERRLRFFAPRDVALARGELNSSGLYIQDVSGRQMEGVGVRVGTFEPDPGVPSFWAASVEEVADPDPAAGRFDTELRAAVDEARAAAGRLMAEAAGEIRVERDRMRREIDEARDAALAVVLDRALPLGRTAEGQAAEPLLPSDQAGGQ